MTKRDKIHFQYRGQSIPSVPITEIHRHVKQFHVCGRKRARKDSAILPWPRAKQKIRPQNPTETIINCLHTWLSINSFKSSLITRNKCCQFCSRPSDKSKNVFNAFLPVSSKIVNGIAGSVNSMTFFFTYLCGGKCFQLVHVTRRDLALIWKNKKKEKKKRKKKRKLTLRVLNSKWKVSRSRMGSAQNFRLR